MLKLPYLTLIVRHVPHQYRIFKLQRCFSKDPKGRRPLIQNNQYRPSPK